MRSRLLLRAAVPGVLVLPLLGCADPAPVPASPAAATGTANAPAKIGLCASCHGVDGISRIAGTPHLAGQDRQYLERALSDYRSGRRQHVPMTSLANTLQPADIGELAAWYASRPGFAAGGAP